ncbi:hypothetical protein [Capnocytophaga sp. oral taxon 338]|uniref:hypothetical protein n=1 Tax=Capnocytophaga sp. oral taxon 338 TaxID=710239 RepID=UPI000202FB4F|nr:hypothetical protein [Capnocytophaga sp. oral taxon 338]EGD34814.1 hypothetical protein HMPREF9071_0736 [Capnocytophaga sp. oral taxon 338 str. F0234]
MSEIITIYCEGQKESHDITILNKVIDGLNNILIKPIGGKLGSKAIVQYLENNQERELSKSKDYLLFRDRDFDQPIPNKERLIIEKKTCYSYRTTIENYLLDVKTFFHFLQEQENNYGIATEEAVKTFFIKVAKELQYYQAVRHSLGALRFANSFDTTWEKGSGTLPNALDLGSCKANAWQLIEKVLNKSNQQCTKKTFETTLQEFLTLFEAQSFFDELKFLVYYQGKDFAKALSKELPRFSIENYYKYAKKHFDYTKYLDLVELRAFIEKLLV